MVDRGGEMQEGHEASAHMDGHVRRGVEMARQKGLQGRGAEGMIEQQATEDRRNKVLQVSKHPTNVLRAVPTMQFIEARHGDSDGVQSRQEGLDYFQSQQ